MKIYGALIAGFVALFLSFVFNHVSFYNDKYALFTYGTAVICIVLSIYIFFCKKNIIQKGLCILLLVFYPVYMIDNNKLNDEMYFLLYKKPTKFKAYRSEGFSTVSMWFYTDGQFLIEATDFMNTARHTGIYAVEDKKLLLHSKHRLNDYWLSDVYFIRKEKIIPSHALNDSGEVFLYLNGQMTAE